MTDQMIRGPFYGPPGSQTPRTAGLSGAQRVQPAHGRYLDAARNDRLFTFGISDTVLTNANAIATGLTGSARPIIGVWNPATSRKSLVILEATLIVTTLANNAVSPAGFMWVYSIGNSAISTGSAPVNCGTLASGESAAKAFAISTPVTGLTNNLVALRPVPIAPANAVGAATAASIIQAGTVERVDGGFIVPPGGVLGIMAQAATVTINMSAGMLWEEVPVGA